MPGNYRTGHGQKTLYVGIDHRIPVRIIAFILRFKTERKAGIVDEHIYFTPLRGQRGDSLLARLAVAHIEFKRIDIISVCGLEFRKNGCIASGHNDPISGLHKMFGARTADAACGTGHHSYLFHGK